MESTIKIKEPLSQIWFVHDYIQLRFQEQIISVYNTPELFLADGTKLDRESKGFCDILVAQIEQPIEKIDLTEGLLFAIRFTSGVIFCVPLNDEAAINGPEALELPGAQIVFNT